MLVVGGTILYVELALFPNEEGELQNRIEKLWIVVDEKQKLEVARATIVFSRVGQFVTRLYNRILGAKLISLQMVGVSSASSIGAFFTFGGLVLLTLLYMSFSSQAKVSMKFNASLLLVGLLCLAIACFVFLFALVPSLVRNWFGRMLSLVPLFLFTYGSFKIVTQQAGGPTTNQIGVLAGLLVGIVTDVLVLAGVRFSARQISRCTRLTGVLVALLVQFLALTFIIIIPDRLSTWLLGTNSQSTIAKILLSTVMFNCFTALGIIGFLLLLIVVFLHRLFWPTLGRVIFSIARFKPLQTYRKAFVTVGVTCVLYGIGFLGWNRFSEWLLKTLAP